MPMSRAVKHGCEVSVGKLESVKTLGLYAAFECTGCGDCCRTGWRIPVERAVHARALEMLKQGNHSGRVQAEDAFVPCDTPTEKAWVFLAQTDEGACVFLEEDNSCYWHRHFGYETKGWVCRAYPNTACATPDTTLVDGALSCRPMMETMKERFAGPMGLVEVPANTFASAVERPRWQLADSNVLLLGDDRFLHARALMPLVSALLEFPQVDGVALGVRMLMGRLFLQQLIDTTADSAVVDTADVQAALSVLEEDGTALYVEAMTMGQRIDDIGLLATVVRGFIARLANVGMPADQAARFEQIIEALCLNEVNGASAARLTALHKERFLPVLEQLSGLLAGYASHRLVRFQALIRGGVTAGFTEALIALMLVWAFALATAQRRSVMVDLDILGDAIREVELIFFHTPEFQEFFQPGVGFSSLYAPTTAALMSLPFVSR